MPAPRSFVESEALAFSILSVIDRPTLLLIKAVHSTWVNLFGRPQYASLRQTQFRRLRKVPE
jgi:hypothetical protein